MKKQDSHIFQGMRRDKSPLIQEAQYLWDAHNIRLTQREGDTFLSMTNEKGTSLINLVSKDNKIVTIKGTYLGHNVINSYLVLFTTTGENSPVRDYIYRIDKNKNYETIILFSGNLNFSLEHPIETINDYENEDIQKVYWVDGLNQPRLINIANDNKEYNNDSFDFRPSLKYYPEINVTKSHNSTSLFPAGVLNYHCTYTDLYGRESAIFWSSQDLYTTMRDRGGSPEEIVSSVFTINISTNSVDTSFDFIRVYSVLYTSVGSVVCKLVTEIKISDIISNIGINSFYSIVDNNSTGELIEYSYLQSLGENAIIPSTLASKDGTLFFGNIRLMDEIKIPDDYKLTPALFFEDTHTIIYPTITDEEYYNFNFSLDSNKLSRTFKSGECYRFGLQFQDKYGVWSKVVFIDDYIITSKPETFVNNGFYSVNLPRLTYTGDFTTLIDKGFVRARGVVVLPKESQRRVIAQGMLCPTVYQVSDRESNAPYVQSSWFIRPFLSSIDIKHNYAFNNNYFTKTRIDFAKVAVEVGSTAPWKWSDSTYSANKEFSITPLDFFYATYNYQDSTNWKKFDSLKGIGVSPWTSVPSEGDSFWKHAFGYWGYIWDGSSNLFASGHNIMTGMLGLISDYEYEYSNAILGANVQFRHNYCLLSGADKGAEIQCAPFETSGTAVKDLKNWQVIQYFPYKSNRDNDISKSKWTSVFAVDQSFCTLHSPDIEFSDLQILSEQDVKLNIIGYIDFTSNIGDINIQTSSTTIEENTLQPRLMCFDNKRTKGINGIYTTLGFDHRTLFAKNRQASRGLTAGLFFRDRLVDDDGGEFVKYPKDHRSYSHDHRSSHDKESWWIPICNFMVYPWHKSGSLNNDCERPEGLGTRTALLKRKVISNLKFGETRRFNSINTTIDDILKFDSNEQELLVLHKNGESFNYYGNVDTLIIPPIPYSSIFSFGTLDGKLPYLNKYYDNVQLDLGKAYILSDRTTQHGDRTTNYFYRTLLFDRDGNYRVRDTGGFFESSALSYFQVEGISSSGSTCHIGTIHTNIYGENEYEVIESDGEVYTHIGDTKSELAQSIETVRMKYKSTPHCIIKLNSTNLEAIDNPLKIQVPHLLLGELIREIDNPFGDTSDYNMSQQEWVVAGEPVLLKRDSDVDIRFLWGDTWYQRYDCLKTYPYTQEDENSIVEIASFMCESRINVEGRYDKNRGLKSNFYVSPTNFNLINKAYSVIPSTFIYRNLSEDFYKRDSFPTTLSWSVQKISSQRVDPWTQISMASTEDIRGNLGSIISLKFFNGQIYCFQQKGISVLNFNSRVQIPSSDNIPIEITNNYKMEGVTYIHTNIGSNNKWSIVVLSNGIYFIDTASKDLYFFNGQQLEPVSTAKNMEVWFSKLNNNSWKPNEYTTKLFYDENYKDLYVVNTDESIVFSDVLAEFTSFMSYKNVPAMFNIEQDFYSLYNGRLWRMFTGANNYIFNKFEPYDFTYISQGGSEDSLADKIFTNINVNADFYDKDNILNHSKFFDYIQVYNEYQDTGEVPLKFNRNTPSNLKKKFRTWRVDIPRNHNSSWNKDRIRNQWTYIKFGTNMKPVANNVQGIKNLLDNEHGFRLQDLYTTYYF